MMLTTSTLSTATIWLFFMIFVSVQRHRLYQDCCYGEVLLIEQQRHQQQHQQHQPQNSLEEMLIFFKNEHQRQQRNEQRLLRLLETSSRTVYNDNNNNNGNNDNMNVINSINSTEASAHNLSEAIKATTTKTTMKTTVANATAIIIKLPTLSPSRPPSATSSSSSTSATPWTSSAFSSSSSSLSKSSLPLLLLLSPTLLSDYKISDINMENQRSRTKREQTSASSHSSQSAAEPSTQLQSLTRSPATSLFQQNVMEMSASAYNRSINQEKEEEEYEEKMPKDEEEEEEEETAALQSQPKEYKVAEASEEIEKFVNDEKSSTRRRLPPALIITPSSYFTRTDLGDDRPLRRRHTLTPEKLQYTAEISIKQGRLMGIVRRMQPNSGLRDVNQYLGLPYAEAPVGTRRFMPPGAPLPWQGLKLARHLPPVCPQKLPDINAQDDNNKMPRGRFKQITRLLPYLKTESEDCLYLNVYVPREDGLGPAPPYPVLVYIHGESFEWNSGNPYDGSVLASYGQVIVVTINYRLGVFGFLKPSISERTVANFALLDQIAALHWIKENIFTFGGDRESVTLMGHSTGAACVNYLMVSPVASGLFHRAILMSGSSMSDWAASNHSLQLTMQIAHNLDCPLMDDHDQMIDCLRGKSYQDILRISTSLPQFSTSLGPIVDGHVIPNQPYRVMGTAELFGRYDLLFGITESEAFHMLSASALEQGFNENERDNLLRFYMQSRFDVRPDLALAATIKKYIDMYNNPIKATNMEHRDVVLDILSDARVVGPLIQTGLFHADVNPHNYMYVFGHNSAAGPHANLPHSISGEELAFVFGAPLAPSGPFHNSYSTQEKLLSEAVMTYWTNFAKSGNPKAPWRGTFLNLHAMEWDRYDLDWPEFNKRTQAYINIGIPPSIGYKYRQIYMNFWNKELPDELNQIAAIQQLPFLNAHNSPSQGGSGNFGSSGLLPSQRFPSEVITGHLNRFGNRDKGAEDPVRTLKMLLQETHGKGSSSSIFDVETAAENMYNAPPTFGVIKQPTEEELLYAAHNTLPTNAIWGAIATVATTPMPPNRNRSDSIKTEASASSNPDEEVVKSESTMQLLIGVIVVFIVLNIAIYATFLLQKRRKKSASSISWGERKLGGTGDILSYDGTTDDELKRSKHTTTLDGGDDNSYILDVLRKSNTYEAVKMERAPINGYQLKRQLSYSTVDTHTKVCEWIAGGGNKLCNSLNRHSCHQSSKMSKPPSMTPTFSSLCAGGGSSSGGGSFQQRPSKLNVGVDATPQTRGQSVLNQQPIEMFKQYSTDGRNIIICQEVEVEDQELLMPQNSLNSSCCSSSLLMRQHSAVTEPCDCILPQQEQREPLLPIVHKHSRSDPVELMYDIHKQDEQITSFMQSTKTHGTDINVISRDDEVVTDDAVSSQLLSVGGQLSAIKRRNYPKILPNPHKRNSLPPNGLLLHQIAECGKQPPPVPPPRTISTLGRKRSLLERRCSGNITTSPVMVAEDCTVEEEEPQQIAENTLIVGPIIPKTDFAMSLLRRGKKSDLKKSQDTGLGDAENGESKISGEPEKEECLARACEINECVTRRPTALRLPMFSLEGQPFWSSSHALPAAPAHHTEVVHNIQGPNLAASMPIMPVTTPTSPLYPITFTATTHTPTNRLPGSEVAEANRDGPCDVTYQKSMRILPTPKHSNVRKNNNNKDNNSNSNNLAEAIKSLILDESMNAPRAAAAEAASVTATTITTTTTTTNTTILTNGPTNNTNIKLTNTTTTKTPTTITTATNNNQPLQPQQQQSEINDNTSQTSSAMKLSSNNLQNYSTISKSCSCNDPQSAIPSAATNNSGSVTPAITSSFSTYPACPSSSSSFQSNASEVPPNKKSSLRSSVSSNGSSNASGNSSQSSSSSSSTGTVRTELRQK